MENFNYISSIVIAIATLLNAVLVIINFVSKAKSTTDENFEKRVKEVVEPMIEPMQLDIGKLKASDIDRTKENKLLLRGTLACLKGLQEQGCNGPVTESIKEIETYLIEK